MKPRIKMIAAAVLAASSAIGYASQTLRGSDRADGHTTPSIRQDVRTAAEREPDPAIVGGHDAAKAAGDARAATTSTSVQDSTQAPGAGFSGSFNATATAQLPEPPPTGGGGGGAEEPTTCRYALIPGSLDGGVMCTPGDTSCVGTAPYARTLFNSCYSRGSGVYQARPGSLVSGPSSGIIGWDMVYSFQCVGGGLWQVTNSGVYCGGH